MKGFQTDLSGKNILITGGGGLLGIQHAIALGSQNANVYLLDKDSSKLSKANEILKAYNDFQVFPILCDVTNEGEVKQAFNKLIKSDVFIDTLINNASLNHDVSPESRVTRDTSFENYELNIWKNELDVSLDGTFLMCKYFGSEMARRKFGSIINISSDLSVIAPDNLIYNFASESAEIDKSKAKPISYSVSKTAIIGITRYLAAYWGKDNVRVNALSPGGVYNNHDQRFVDLLIQRIPMGRMANIDEYHAIIIFLCSDGSKYMTGQNIIIDGGRTII